MTSSVHKSYDKEYEAFDCFLNSMKHKPIEILSKPFSRMKSWEDCYLFFQDNLQIYLDSPEKKDDFLDLATLHLAFYLASFGMFRGSLPYLQYSKDLFREPLEQIFNLMRSEGWTTSFLNSNPKELFFIQTNFKKTLRDSLFSAGYKDKGQPSKLLIQKVFLGVYAAVPALDRFATKGLKKLREINGLPKYINKLGDPFRNEVTLEGWILFAQNLEKLKAFQNIEPNQLRGKSYPAMRKLDLILWSAGID